MADALSPMRRIWPTGFDCRTRAVSCEVQAGLRPSLHVLHHSRSGAAVIVVWPWCGIVQQVRTLVAAGVWHEVVLTGVDISSCGS